MTGHLRFSRLVNRNITIENKCKKQRWHLGSNGVELICEGTYQAEKLALENERLKERISCLEEEVRIVNCAWQEAIREAN